MLIVLVQVDGAPAEVWEVLLDDLVRHLLQGAVVQGVCADCFPAPRVRPAQHHALAAHMHALGSLHLRLVEDAQQQRPINLRNRHCPSH